MKKKENSHKKVPKNRNFHDCSCIRKDMIFHLIKLLKVIKQVRETKVLITNIFKIFSLFDNLI